MIWLTWRQFRGQAVTAVAALAAFTTYLVVLGVRIRHEYEASVGCGAGCSLAAARETLQRDYSTTLMMSGFLVVVVPAIVGAFWGAPLIARELETGTHRLVWNQSVTRNRWLTVKLLFVTLAGAALAGALSLLFTWAASPYDKLFGSRFDPMFFPTRNVAPVGYAVFAVVAGIAIGLFTRRTVLAMALTLAAFAVMQVLMPAVVRAHLRSPVTETVAFTAAGAQGLGITRGQRVKIHGFTIPGAWVLTTDSDLLDASGNPVTGKQVTDCDTGNYEAHLACLEDQHMHVTVTYQPADRYWTFQWLEFTVYLVLAGLLAGFAFWRLARGH